MKVVIIEDEEDSRLALKNLVTKYCTGVEVVALAESLEEGVKAINEQAPDFIFLDIEMPGENGFKLFDYFSSPDFEVIFTTAYSQYALNALKMSAVDYLLKPIDLEELRTAINRVKAKKSIKETKEKLEVLKGNLNLLFKKIALPTSTGFNFVPIEEIIRCEAQGNYTMFYFKNGKKSLISKTLKVYSEILLEFNFVRLSRSEIVNLNFVRAYSKGKLPSVTLDDGTVVKLSPTRREVFLQKINDFLGD